MYDQITQVARAIHESRSPIPWEFTRNQQLAYQHALEALDRMPDRAAAISDRLETMHTASVLTS